MERSSVLDSIPEEGNNSIGKEKSSIQGGSEKSISNLQVQCPLLSIDVNFGPNMHDKLTVYKGDDLSIIAHEFAVKHTLSESLENKLYMMLDEQVKSIS